MGNKVVAIFIHESSFRLTSNLWRTLRETNSRAVKGTILRAIRAETEACKPTLGEMLLASGAVSAGPWDQL